MEHNKITCMGPEIGIPVRVRIAFETSTIHWVLAWMVLLAIVEVTVMDVVAVAPRASRKLAS